MTRRDGADNGGSGPATRFAMSPDIVDIAAGGARTTMIPLIFRFPDDPHATSLVEPVARMAMISRTLRE